MDIFQIVTIAFIGTIVGIIIKNQIPQFSFMISLVTCILILFIIVPNLIIMGNIFTSLTSYIDTSSLYIDVIFKIIGISYICEFGCSICNDAGESAIASKVELAGKVLILVIASPMIFSLIELIVTVLP